MSLLQMSFSGAVLILVIILVRAVAMNRLPKKTFLFLWGVTLVRLLIPFSIPSPASVYSLVDLSAKEEAFLGTVLPVMSEEAKGQGGQDGQDATANLPESTGKTEQIQEQQLVKPMSAISIWQVIWCAGAIACMAFFIIVYLRWLLKFRTAWLVRNNHVEQWLEEHRLKRPISIRQSNRIDTPLTYGIFRPVILMPADTDWENIKQLQYVLQHEYVHVCRFDVAAKMICALAVCVHWFNPLVWVMYLLFNRDLELSCDERVVRQFGMESKRNYAHVLINMEAKKSGLMPFYNSFSKNAIEERITSIMKIKKTSIMTIVTAVILIVGITVACATSAIRAENKEIHQDTQGILDDDTGNGDAAISEGIHSEANSGNVFEAVLLGDAEFIYVSDGDGKAMDVADIPSLFDADDPYMKVWDFAVVDLDGDGKEEVVLFVVGMAGDMGGNLILHQIGDKVYGYATNYRILEEMKEDGTFNFSHPAGVEGGIGAITVFSEHGYVMDQITYGTGTHYEWDMFTVDHQPATEEEYINAVANQKEKPNVEWYDFNPENIRARLKDF